MKFIHKNTGFIVCGVILGIAGPMLYYESAQQEFFEKWTCPQLWVYVMTDSQGSKFPKPSDLDPDQKIKLDNVMDDCISQLPANNTVLKYER